MTLSISVLTTYPPTQCGIATFSASLIEQLRASGVQVEVVSITDVNNLSSPSEVVHHWQRNSPGGAAAAAEALNLSQVAIIEHEFGIFPGEHGAEVLEVLDALTIPLITVMHTVLAKPTTEQKSIVKAILQRSAQVVVMTQAARERLVDLYQAIPSKIILIPHGAPDTKKFGQLTTPNFRPLILTWGLIGHGKGIEWAIEAMGSLEDLQPKPKYLIAGQTHPKVIQREGEVYRSALNDLVKQKNLQDLVEFDARYLEQAELIRMIYSADIVLLPYDSTEQVTSGVLVEAVTAGKPVISTKFPHAVELLSSGAGILVERQDPLAIAEAIRKVLSQPGLAKTMSGEALRIAPDLLWPAVAERYKNLALATLHSRHLQSASA